MKTTKKTKLALSTETIATMTPDQLLHVNGGEAAAGASMRSCMIDNCDRQPSIPPTVCL